MISKIKSYFSSSEKKIFFNFAFSSFVKTIILAITNIVILRWVSPAEIGIYNSFNVLIAYSFFMQLGVFTGLNREIPYLFGQGKEDEVHELVKTGISYAKILSFSSFFIGFIVFIFTYYLAVLNKNEIKMFLVIIFLISFSFYQNYLNVTFRTSKNFNILARINHASSLVMIFSMLLVYFFSYNGLVLFYFVNAFVFLLLTHLYRPFKLKSEFSKDSFKRLMKVGIPIFAWGYLQQISKTFNRMILLAVGTVYLVGIFSPATAVFTAIAFLPTTIAQFLYPKFSYLYGKYDDTKILIPYVNKIYLLSILLIPPTIIFGYTLIPWAINSYFPKYSEGILATQLFLISGVININTISINIFYSIGNKRSVSIYTITKTALMFICPICCLPFFSPLTAISIGTLIGFVITSSFAYYLLINTLNGRYR